MNEILPLAIGIGSLGANVTIVIGALVNPGGILLHDEPYILLIEAIFFISLASYLFARLLTKMYSSKHVADKKKVRKKRNESNQS